jgi:hypothetical protein
LTLVSQPVCCRTHNSGSQIEQKITATKKNIPSSSQKKKLHIIVEAYQVAVKIGLQREKVPGLPSGSPPNTGFKTKEACFSDLVGGERN